MRRVVTKLGELDTVVLEGGPEGSKPTLAVVLCHGFGASGEDLVPLAPALAQAAPQLAQGVRFVFPAAPLSLAAMGMPRARAWWQLPPEVLMGLERDWATFQDAVPEGLATARRALHAVVDAVAAGSGLPLSRVVLGGFSQGAMVATDLALRLEEPPAGLALLSGTLLARKEWMRLAARRVGLPVLQAHGRFDDVLPFAQAEALTTLLAGAGLDVAWLPFDGPHTIPTETLEALADFLVARLGP